MLPTATGGLGVVRDGVAEPNLVLFVVSCVCLFRSRAAHDDCHGVACQKETPPDLQQHHTLLKTKAKRLCFDMAPQGPKSLFTRLTVTVFELVICSKMLR